MVLVEINLGIVPALKNKYIHQVVVHFIGVYPAILSVAGTPPYGRNLVTKTFELEIILQAHIVFTTYRNGIIDGPFPIVVGQHIQNHHLILKDALLIQLEAKFRDNFMCVTRRSEERRVGKEV